MGRSVLFLMFLLAAMGCGSDPATDGDTQQGAQDGSEPNIQTGVGPPFAVGIDQVARMAEGVGDAEKTVEAQTFSDRDVIRSPATGLCPSLRLCLQVDRRRQLEIAGP